MADSLGEYRFLLLKRRRATFLEKLKYLWLTSSPEKIVAFSLLILLFLGIIVALINFISLNTASNSSQQLYLKVNDATQWEFQDTHDRKVFLEEWKKESSTIISLKKLLMVLYDRTLLDNNKMDFKGAKNVDESDILSMCSIVLEHLKRILNKCVDIEILPYECKKVIQKPFKCSPLSVYRSIDGSCNNLHNPEWGMHGVANRRWLDAAFSDDVSLPRLSVHGNSLPNPRYLSSTLFLHKTMPDSNITMLFTHFGLYLDHDIVRSGQAKENLNKCCEQGFHHPACMQMDISPSDYFYGPLNVSCLGFLRNTATIGECPGRREHLNLMTAFVDASDLYGPTNKESADLRAFENGRLRTSKVNNTVLLPFKESAGNSCYTSQRKHKCFASGDVRTNMLLPLMTLHTIWAREHNRLADELNLLNPTWNDETLFQEARRILIAELQCITYREFLPIIFGRSRMKKLGLFIDENEVYDGYEKTEDPTVKSGFSTAAFRFGHTLVQKLLHLVDADYKIQSKVPLHETYMNPGVLYDGNLDYIIRGMTSQNTQQVEPFTTEEIRGRLLQRFYQNHGLDLSAISILRGRDHGLPPYLQWRKYCNLSAVESWEDLRGFMSDEYVEDLKNAYMSIEDIDLIPGALGEKHEEDSLVGSTYLCLLSKQFLSLRKGDRFWFENPNQPGSFTRDQLKEIYKSSFARFLCNTSDKLSEIQKFPLLKPSEENPIMSCEDFPQMNLLLWKN